MTSTQILQLIVVPMLLCMMITTGLKTTFAEIRSALARRPMMLKALIVNYLLVPSVTVFLLMFFKVSPLVEIGFIILAVCPGAPFGPVAANASRGDVPLAACLMILLSVTSVFMAPLLLYSIMHELPEIGTLKINYGTVIRGLLIFQLLPLLLALFFHQWKPGPARKLVRPFEWITNLLVIVMMVYGIYAQFHRIKQLSLSAIIGMFLLFFISLLLGWFFGGESVPSRKTMALTSAIRNTGISMVIAIDNFSGTITVGVVILWGLIMTVFGLSAIIPFKRIQTGNIKYPSKSIHEQ
jgi:BASS family bile acid:Na+ symporter